MNSEEYAAGYKWARDTLNKGTTEEQVEALIYGSSDDFDEGARQALREHAQ